MTAVAITPPLGDQVILESPYVRASVADLLRAGFSYYFPDTGGVVFRGRAGLFVVRVRLATSAATGCRLDLGMTPNRHADGPVWWRPWSIDHDGTPAAVVREALGFFRVADQAA